MSSSSIQYLIIFILFIIVVIVKIRSKSYKNYSMNRPRLPKMENPPSPPMKLNLDTLICHHCKLAYSEKALVINKCCFNCGADIIETKISSSKKT